MALTQEQIEQFINDTNTHLEALSGGLAALLDRVTAIEAAPPAKASPDVPSDQPLAAGAGELSNDYDVGDKIRIVGGEWGNNDGICEAKFPDGTVLVNMGYHSESVLAEFVRKAD